MNVNKFVADYLAENPPPEKTAQDSVTAPISYIAKMCQTFSVQMSRKPERPVHNIKRSQLRDMFSYSQERGHYSAQGSFDEYVRDYVKFVNRTHEVEIEEDE